MNPIPPDISNTYMALGYTAVALLLVGLIGYLANRTRRLREELALLIELDNNAPALPLSDKTDLR
ncbi:MAG: hypothetical protein ACYDBJ_18710 [Aggregatilineales bacterium]